MSHIKDDGTPIAYDDPNELINQVIATLAVPSDTEETFVSKQYNNSKNDQNEIQAYAKIAGRDWTYFVKTLNIGIGRNTDNHNQPTSADQQVSIDLGPSKVVSRRHAEINYNLNTRKWMLKVLGRNGLKVDGVRAVNPGPDSEPIPLDCGNIIDIGGTQMMFILPDCSPVISKQFLDNLKDKKLTKNKNGGYDALPNSNLKGFQIFNKSQINDGETHSSSPGSKIGEQDLSKDESKDIKPPFSYATMITQAILTNPEGILSLSEIYDWISSHYAYYRHSKTGWQNSIRHNLSLNKAFDKVPRKPNEPGKGMKWCIAPAYKNEFMKKWETGGIKARRGSSVTRQLQLHLLKNKRLPDDSLSQHQFHQTMKANPQLPQIKHIGSMPPPFQQQQQPIQQQQQQQQPLQQYPAFHQQPAYHHQLQPAVSLQQHQPQQQLQLQQNQHFSLPMYNNHSNNNNTNLINNQHIKLAPPPQSSSSSSQHHDQNILSTPNRNTNGKLPNGLSSPQAPLSAERGGGGPITSLSSRNHNNINHNHHTNNSVNGNNSNGNGNVGGFGDFVYSSPTKENSHNEVIDLNLDVGKLG